MGEGQTFVLCFTDVTTIRVLMYTAVIIETVLLNQDFDFQKSSTLNLLLWPSNFLLSLIHPDTTKFFSFTTEIPALNININLGQNFTQELNVRNGQEMKIKYYEYRESKTFSKASSVYYK